MLRLAVENRCSPSEVLRRYRSDELTEMQAYEEMFPFTLERLDALFGHLIAATMNSQGGIGGKAVDPYDTIPDWGGLRKREADDDG